MTPIDPRRHRAQTERRMALGLIAIMYAVGGGMIWWLYGPAAAFLAWGCLTSLLAVAGLVWLILWAIAKWVGD